MFVAFKAATVLVVAIAMSLALAHTLEWPGKRRLPKEHYLAVQPIYYPGFTFGALSEPVGFLMLAVLTAAMPAGTAAFWLTAGAGLSLLAMHATYWLFTHPVNKLWIKNVALKGAGKTFFAADPLRRGGPGEAPDWTVLRDRREMSHAMRAGFGLVSLAPVASAVALSA